MDLPRSFATKNSEDRQDLAPSAVLEWQKEQLALGVRLVGVAGQKFLLVAHRGVHRCSQAPASVGFPLTGATHNL